MIHGLLGGILWALDTVILGIALNSTVFISTPQAVILAPFVSTFLHDTFSCVYTFIYLMIKRQIKQVAKGLRTRSGLFIICGALLGGPIGMSCYVSSINAIGPSTTAIITSMYPAVGAFFAYIFLKEKMSLLQVCGLLLSICGVILLGYGGSVSTVHPIGYVYAIACCIGWALEGVILAYGMKDPSISNEHALKMRQLTSMLVYGIVILNVMKGYSFTFEVIRTNTIFIVMLASLFGTCSYLFYYKAISLIGASKSMALNITYSAWSIVFSTILLSTPLDMKSIVCTVMILVGSLVACRKKKSI